MRLTLKDGVRNRESLVRTPSLVGSGALPVVVMLHGAGGTAEWADEETGWSAAGEAEGFITVLPEGVPLNPSKPAKFLTNPQVWNPESERGPAPPPEQNDVEFVRSLLAELPRHLPIDERRIYLTGFSNGAALAFRLAAELSDRFAALAPVAGLCPLPDPRPPRPIPTLYLIGDADPLVPLDGGIVRLPWGGLRVESPPVRQTIERWARAIRSRETPARMEERHGLRVEDYPAERGGAELRVGIVEGLGHHWPGGLGRLDERIGGPATNKVNGTKLIWDFFRQHALG